MLEKEFKYYVEHQDELVEMYGEKVIILKNETVIGVFDTLSEAYFYAEANDLIGQAMIHQVGPGENNFTTTLSSSLLFA